MYRKKSDIKPNKIEIRGNLLNMTKGIWQKKNPQTHNREKAVKIKL